MVCFLSPVETPCMGEQEGRGGGGGGGGGREERVIHYNSHDCSVLKCTQLN